jgi:hypothetical protein
MAIALAMLSHFKNEKRTSIYDYLGNSSYRSSWILASLSRSSFIERF